MLHDCHELHATWAPGITSLACALGFYWKMSYAPSPGLLGWSNYSPGLNYVVSRQANCMLSASKRPLISGVSVSFSPGGALPISLLKATQIQGVFKVLQCLTSAFWAFVFHSIPWRFLWSLMIKGSKSCVGWSGCTIPGTAHPFLFETGIVCNIARIATLLCSHVRHLVMNLWCWGRHLCLSWTPLCDRSVHYKSGAGR